MGCSNCFCCCFAKFVHFSQRLKIYIVWLHFFLYHVMYDVSTVADPEATLPLRPVKSRDQEGNSNIDCIPRAVNSKIAHTQRGGLNQKVFILSQKVFMLGGGRGTEPKSR